MNQPGKSYVIIRIYLLLLVFFVTTISCASGPVSGLLYSKTSFPGTINPDASVRRELRAQGCVHNFLTLFSVGNAGAGEIAFKNGIGRVSLIDHSSMQILTLLYRNYCTIVIGEKG
ncbi:TRL-like family protein [Leptospira broomii serovar Hurstbridge str. 5399]|uniref:TRL-like family protein n=1 Tax=Leptospira broomii serovar Hurstbridge str. 5399 TaxID=1049789 RepID=T0FBJ4_9LEPT|nr:TRL domain-containing protein [Leptospira broomii]EQA45241.1 TRL-like family protein [Leptospira broomii serovar Hurstbridge str. 5399]